jgi:CheY-like chemotaxis protein
MKKVLIVEDDLKSQRILQTRLQKYKDKFEIVLANNGEEAMGILKQKEISLIVTDVQMPKVDGMKLLAYVNENHHGTPCIVMTAFATAEIKERLSKDALTILKKPFLTDELVQAITKGLKPAAPDGSLTGISVANFLQLIEMEQKTCLLEITLKDGEKGILYFKNGALYDAIYGDLKGENAALEIIAMDGASINLGNLPAKKITRSINADLMGLIMEAMRRKDESNG